jgi:serine phosphatase RsbU (regulator of sigma subunit)
MKYTAMKKVIPFLLLYFVANALFAQKGAPLLTHYKESREIENQSWSVCQDQNNVMIFANRRGIMTFDGQSWNIINMPAVPYVIKYNKANNKVYAGCDGNYGYLEKDEKGFYKFVSILTDSANVGLISQIMFTDSSVYFYGESSVNRHSVETNKLEKRFLPKENEQFTGMFITQKNTFINVLSKGLYRVEADTLFPIVTGYLTENEEILFSLPYDDNKVLLGLSNSTLSLFDGIKYYDYKIQDDGYLLQSTLSDGLVVNDSIYAFSTLDGGALVIGKKSRKIINTINYQRGLPDDEILAMGVDNKNGLWLSHQYGLSRADLGLPVLNFSIYPGLRGNITSTLWYNKELYVATSEGLFYLTEVKDYDEIEVLVKKEQITKGINLPSSAQETTLAPSSQEPVKVKKTLLSRIFGKKTTTESSAKAAGTNSNAKTAQFSAGQIKSVKIAEPQYVKKTINRLKSVNYLFKKIGGFDEKCKQLVSTPFGILASTNRGLYNISSHSARIVAKDLYINYIDRATRDGKYYVATSQGYFYVTYRGGNWSAEFPDNGFVQPLYSITSVSNEELWAGSTSVAYKITPGKNGSSAEYKTYNLENDFPKKYIVENLNDTVFLLTESGISYYDQNKDSFVNYKRVELGKGSKFSFLFTQPGVPWFKEGDEWKSLANDKQLIPTDKALLKIFEELVSINLADDFIWVVTGDNHLFRIERNKNLAIKPDLDLYIRSISNEDGTYFRISNIVFGRGDNTVYFDLVAPGYLKQNSTQYQYLLEKTMNDWSKWSFAPTITLMLPAGEYSLMVRAKDIWGNISEPKKLKFTIRAPFTETTFFYLLVLILVLGIILMIVRFREGQLKKDKKILEQKVQERTAKIEAQKQEITSSIEYASRIQMAMLPEEFHFTDNFSDYFIIFKPRDIVSGDFYWVGENDKQIFFSVGDCTGHGVPGAFMSTLGISTLNEITNDNREFQASTILKMLREKIKTSLHQTGKEGEAADGMDMAFCVLSKNKKLLQYAGAYNPLFIAQSGEFKEYKADRMPIGIYYGEKDDFTNYEIPVKKGDTLYICSDGIYDQFGGPDGSKYKKANLKKLLADNSHLTMAQQRSVIEKEFNDWRGALEQIDDVTIIGIKI